MFAKHFKKRKTMQDTIRNHETLRLAVDDEKKTPIRPKLSPTNLAVSSPDIKSFLTTTTTHLSSLSTISSSTSSSSSTSTTNQLNRSHPITLINQSISPPHTSTPSSQTESINPFISNQNSTPKPSNHPTQNPITNPITNPTNPNLFDPLPTLPSRLRKASLKLIPPPNFGLIESSLYRSGEPNELSYKFLGSLNLKSLIWLAPRPISSSL